MAMQAPIHVSDSESVMPRIIAVVAGIAILGAVAFGFVAASGAWSPPATTSQSQSHSS